MKRFLPSHLFFLLVIFLLGNPSQGNGQVVGALTAGGIIAAAEGVLTKLQNVGTAMTGNVGITVGGAATEFSNLLEKFRTITKDNINTPITSLGMDVRALGTQLQETTERIDQIVDKQRECIFQNLDLFLSGMQTVVSDLKRGLIISTKLDDPRLIGFRFESRKTSSIVPLEGGKVILKGYRLWDNDGYEPEITLWNSNRDTKFATLIPNRGSNVNELIFSIDPSLIINHVGECLQLNVKTYTKKKFLLIKYGRKSNSDLYTSMCVPSEYGTNLVMQGTLNYTTSRSERRVLSTKEFRYKNYDMKYSKQISETKSWENEIPVGWRIVEISTNVKVNNHDSQINMSFLDNTVSANGHVTDAPDFNPPIGPRVRLGDSDWVGDVTPIIGGVVEDHHIANITSDPTEFKLPKTKICGDFIVKGEPNMVSTFNVNILQAPKYNGSSVTLYSSNRITTNKNTVTAFDHAGKYNFNLSYNPTIAGGNKTQLCVVVDSNDQCGF